MVTSTKAQSQAPATSRDQRMEALKRATDILLRRAKLQKDLMRGREENDFLEWVTYVGNRYGTLLSEIERGRNEGGAPLLELETEGALAVKERVPGAVTIFVTAPVAELERRLRERATESTGDIRDRIDLAQRQLEQADRFDYVVENDDRERAANQLAEIVQR